MALLIFYLAFAVGVSFCCSLCEAVILSLPDSAAEVRAQAGRRSGLMLRTMKAQIDRPLGAILTLNTIANTFGAAGVGAQAGFVFESIPVGLVSAALTLTILIVSEIIPKTIGAVHAERLAAPVAYVIQGMILLTWPALIVLNAIARFVRGAGSSSSPTRDQIAVIAELARIGGALDASETELLRNLLVLRDTDVDKVMTPRTVAFTLRSADTPASVIAEHPRLRFSRIPVLGDKPDEILGVVLKHEIHENLIHGDPDRRIGGMTHTLRYVPETAPLTKVLDEFARYGCHMFGVADEYGSFVGLVTLEDIVESILGAEIVDETDPVADMRELTPTDPPMAPDGKEG